MTRLALGLVLIAGCSKKADDPKPEQKDEKPEEHHDQVKLSAEVMAKYGVKAEAVTRRKLTPTVIAPGRVSFNLESIAHVGAVLRGRVVDVKIHKGDSVKKGDELLTIESPELGEAQGDLLQRRATAAAAGPNLELTRASYDRAKKLFDESKGITLTELQRRESELKATEANKTSAAAAVAAAENKLRLLGMTPAAIDRLTTGGKVEPVYAVTSPVGGRVIDRDVVIGELVGPDKEALVVVADTAVVWVMADVTESKVSSIVPGAAARVRCGAGVIEGKVSVIDAAVEPGTRTAGVRIEVDNKDGRLRAGTFAEVEIDAGSQGDTALAVPEGAVQTVDGKAAVFVAVSGEDNTFVKRPVTVGKSIGGWVPVISGLDAGESVVTAGSFLLKAELGKGSVEED